jgi:uncharacterized protein YlxW (UPF0749 family)
MDQNNALKLSDVFSLIQQFIQFYKSFKKYNYLIIIGFTVICLLYYPIEKSKYEANASLLALQNELRDVREQRARLQSDLEQFQGKYRELEKVSEEGKNLIRRMLVVDTTKRITAD